MTVEMGSNTLDLGSWCILRMASGDTLRVVKSLGDAGLTVWTPVEKRFSRAPRSKARAEREFALMPSYVFGHVSHLDDLVHLSSVPPRDHPPFTMFRHQGGIPLIADAQLDALRGEESRITRIFEKLRNVGRKGPRFSRGTDVRMPEGPFMGLAGVVEGQSGEYTLVSFAGFPKPIKVASLLLLPDSVQDETNIAAQAA